MRRVDSVPVRALRAAEDWLIWRGAAAEALHDVDALLSDSLVEALQRSASVLFDWRIPIEWLARSGDDESLLLARTLATVETRCAAIRAVPSHRLMDRLPALVPRRSLTFAGFIASTAARANLLEHWTDRGAQVRDHRAEAAVGTSRVVASEDATDEIDAAAGWCREQLDRDPTRRLLVVVPDLDQRRYAVSQAFEMSLAPQVAMGRERDDPERALFAIEGGQTLASFPLVHQALASLRFLCVALDFVRWSEWLRSSFWNSPSVSDRSKLEVVLRAVLDIDVDARKLDSAMQACPSHLTAIAAEIRGAIARASQLLELESSATRAWVWSRRFGAALRALGWPGSRGLSSAEQQTLVRFQEILAELAALGSSLGPLRAVDALKILEDLAGRTLFEPATGDAAVTLSASLSDPVVRYDGIWVAGLHADAWPRPVSIDPFIPLAAQRQANIPAASAIHLLEQARELQNVWRRSTDELVVSWPRHEGDREHLPSPLIEEASKRSRQAAKPTEQQSLELRLATLPQLIRASRRVETYEDSAGEPWPVAKLVPAGVRTLEYQNRCPVLAYGEFRLGAAPLETPRPGVDFRDRGMLVHRALELLWKRLGDSQELHAAYGQRLDAMIDESVAQAMADAFAVGGVFQERRSTVREHRRTARLIRALCDLELQRVPFRVVELEGERRWQSAAGSALRLRIDRIDQLDDGRFAIFDYKSGAVQTQDWLSNRVTHPQLLVYMLASGVDVSAMATVQLTPAGVGFKGIADRKGRLPRVTTLEGAEVSAPQRWAAQTDRWRDTIEQLAAQFAAGSAALNPMENACRVCHLHAFCRIADLPGDDDCASE